MVKVLNLYAGIGGNRKLWTNCKVTAIEYDKNIAAIYSKLYPKDKVIVTDAHKYLLDNYKKYDFIWSSPPCQTHSKSRYAAGSAGDKYKAVYPDMKLWQEIIFLQYYCKCKWVIENVTPYYTPFIKPTVKIQRHLFWSNFIIYNKHFKSSNIELNSKIEDHIDFKIVKDSNIKNKRQVLRNKVDYEIGLHIFNCALDKNNINLTYLF